jgi:tripartite-type tricarboxylate transporter receptor subunit TctC
MNYATVSNAIAPMIAKAYPTIGQGANEKKCSRPIRGIMKKAQGNSALSRRRVIKAAGVLAAGMAAPAFLRIRSAYAAYPERPVKIVVANTPGGPSDIVGRITAAALEQATGKTFIVENRGGAGGNIGMAYAAHAEPDGYTVLLATNAYSVNVGLYTSLPYDADKDFVGVSELATSPNTFVVQSALPAKTMKEFAELARANPEKFNCSTPPIGTTPQIQLEVFKLRENLPKLEDVVYKGGGDALQALLSGTSQLSSGSLPPAAQHIKAGSLRCLAVTGDSRWPDMPDVPTMVEAGYKDFVFATDTVLLAPAKTPPENIKWLETETLKVLSTPEMKDKLFKAGFQVRPKGAADAWARVTKEITLFKDIIDKSGMKKL